MKHLLHLSYLGTNYCGFQVQPEREYRAGGAAKGRDKAFLHRVRDYGLQPDRQRRSRAGICRRARGAWHVGHPRGIGAARAEYLSSAGYLGASQ